MPLYALDTDMASLLLGEHAAASARAARVPAKDRALPIVTVQELLAGWLPPLSRPQPSHRYVALYAKFRRTLDYVRSATILDLGPAAGEEYVRLRSMHPQAGTNDLKIAAIALAHGAVLVTRNQAHFGQIQRLVIEDWS